VHGTRGFALLGTGAVVTAALGVSVTAYAASTAFDGTDGAGGIHACFVQSTGSLRVIDTASGATCKKGETPLTWAQSASAPIVQYDSVSRFTEPAFFDSNAPAPAPISLTSLAFTKPTGGFVNARLSATIAFDAGHSCSTPGAFDVLATMYLDGTQTGPTVMETEQPDTDANGNPTGTYQDQAGGEPFLEEPWVGPGIRTITVAYSPAGCTGGGTGTVTVSDVHVLVTSP
jgi:hypothetical protein